MACVVFVHRSVKKIFFQSTRACVAMERSEIQVCGFRVVGKLVVLKKVSWFAGAAFTDARVLRVLRVVLRVLRALRNQLLAWSFLLFVVWSCGGEGMEVCTLTFYLISYSASLKVWTWKDRNITWENNCRKKENTQLPQDDRQEGMWSFKYFLDMCECLLQIKVRWGILSTGSIASAFVKALKGKKKKG